MASRSSTLADVRAPARVPRRDHIVANSRHCVARYRSTTTRPASARRCQSCCCSGRMKRMATAATTSAVPIQPRTLTKRVMVLRLRTGLPAPPIGIDRSGGEEEPERDHAQVVDDMLGVDHALREILEVLEHRQRSDDAAGNRAGALANPR